jgi:hypothetical protein
VFPTFKLGRASAQANVAVFICKLHKHFEEKIPDYVQKCPLFLDWVTTRIIEIANYANKAIDLMDLIRFHGAYNPDVHDGGLPASVAAMPGVNNLIFSGAFANPDINKEHFRVCMHIAPFTKVLLSVMGPLQDMDFAANQFGEQMTTMKITIVNNSAFFRDYRAFGAPATKLSAPMASSMFCLLMPLLGFTVTLWKLHLPTIRNQPCSQAGLMKKSKSVPVSSKSNSPFSIMSKRKSLPFPFPLVKLCPCHLSPRNPNFGCEWDSSSPMSLKNIIKTKKPVTLNGPSTFLMPLTDVKPCSTILG